MTRTCGRIIRDANGRQTFPKVAPALFSAYDSTGGQTVNGTDVTLNLDTVVTNTDAAVVDLTSDVVTLTQGGGGHFSAVGHVTIGNTGGDDFGFDFFCELAPAATGIYAEIQGSRVSGGKGT